MVWKWVESQVNPNNHHLAGYSREGGGKYHEEGQQDSGWVM